MKKLILWDQINVNVKRKIDFCRFPVLDNPSKC